MSDIRKLSETVDMMVSNDYKERFKAEMLRNWDKLNFTPTCRKEIYERQLCVMVIYFDILIERALKEGVEL